MFHSVLYSFCTYVLVYRVLCTSVLVFRFVMFDPSVFSAIPIHFTSTGSCLGGGGCSVGACMCQVPSDLPKPRRMHQ